MADVAMADHEKDEKLMQFLSMIDDKVDPEVASALLAASNWDLQMAVSHLYDGPASGTAARRAPPMDAGMHGMDDDDDFGALVPEVHHAPLGPGRMDIDPGMGHEDHDLQFALAGQQVSEEELIQQALQASQREEDTRQRQSLREQQEMELQESLLMDRMRAEQRVAEAAQLEAVARAEQAHQVAAQKAEREAERALEAKKAALPAEPAADEPGRRALMLRLPGGKRLQRAFRATETVGVIYDFVDVTEAELAGQSYRLVTTLPRHVFEDRQQTLEAAGIQNQFVLMVEVATSA